jgi:TPP-dependent indolepyruvate ferredoxin oxidoreductase alpha subunit
MTWVKTAEDRQRDQQVYGSPEYRRNRALARRRANGTCEGCHHRHPQLQCDHITPKSSGAVSNALSNLQMLCTGDGSCKCHDKKTYAQRQGHRGKGKSDPAPRIRRWW